jgi:hypothetical protein
MADPGAAVLTMPPSVTNGSVLDMEVTFTDTYTGQLADPGLITCNLEWWPTPTGPRTQFVLHWGMSFTFPVIGSIWKKSTGTYALWVDTTPYIGYLSCEWVGSGAGAIIASVAGGAVVYMPDTLDTVAQRTFGTDTYGSGTFGGF